MLKIFYLKVFPRCFGGIGIIYDPDAEGEPYITFFRYVRIINLKVSRSKHVRNQEIACV